MLKINFISSDRTGYSDCGEYAYYLDVYELYVDGKFLGRAECPSKYILSYDEMYDEEQSIFFYPAEGVEVYREETLLNSSDDIGGTWYVDIKGITYSFYFWGVSSEVEPLTEDYNSNVSFVF